MTERHELIVRTLDNAEYNEVLSEEAREVLDRPHVQEYLALASGTPAAQMNPKDILLISILADDSGSLNKKKNKYTEMVEWCEPDDDESNAQAVRIGHSAVLEALRKSLRPETVFLSTHLLNGGVLDPYHPLAKAVRLTRENFKCLGDTPLFPRAVDVLGSVLYKSQEVEDRFKNARTATLIISDGGDTSGTSPDDVDKIVRDLLATGQHIVAAMGISDGHTDFKAVFKSMGIEERWILTPKSTQTEIQKALGMFAEVASRATNVNEFPLLLESGFHRGLTPK